MVSHLDILDLERGKLCCFGKPVSVKVDFERNDRIWSCGVCGDKLLVVPESMVWEMGTTEVSGLERHLLNACRRHRRECHAGNGASRGVPDVRCIRFLKGRVLDAERRERLEHSLRREEAKAADKAGEGNDIQSRPIPVQGNGEEKKRESYTKGDEPTS